MAFPTDESDISPDETNKGGTMKPMMKCGCRANATNQQGKPVCVICVGIHPGAETIDDNPPDFGNRIAKCWYCKKEKPSTDDLAFFVHRSGNDYDTYYCGCKGWD